MTYIPDLDKGIKHVHFVDHNELVVEEAIAYRSRCVSEGKGATWGILSSFCQYFVARANYDWFAKADNNGFFNYAYLAAKCNVMRIHLRPTSISGCSANAVDLLYPLLISDADLIHWHMQYTIPFFGVGQKKRLFEIPYDYQHLCLQARLALQKNWELLIERSEQALALEPKKNKLYKIDYSFYKALGEQNRSGMINALDELLSPKVARHRNADSGWGREQYLFSGWAMLYIKLAQHSGFNLDIEDPWIPKEWIQPMALKTKPNSFDFIDNFNIFSLFDDDPKSWCTNASRYSPRPRDQEPLMFGEIAEELKRSM